jgi:hypothetical protein
MPNLLPPLPLYPFEAFGLTDPSAHLGFGLLLGSVASPYGSAAEPLSLQRHYRLVSCCHNNPSPRQGLGEAPPPSA